AVASSISPPHGGIRLARVALQPSPDGDECLTTAPQTTPHSREPSKRTIGHQNGRSPQKNIAVPAWHAPLGGCAEEADLCGRQGFGRIAPSASPRPEDRHVQGPAGFEGQEGILSRNPDRAWGQGTRLANACLI